MSVSRVGSRRRKFLKKKLMWMEARQDEVIGYLNSWCVLSTHSHKHARWGAGGPVDGPTGHVGSGAAVGRPHFLEEVIGWTGWVESPVPAPTR